MSLHELPTVPHLVTSTHQLFEPFYAPALTFNWLRLAAARLAGLAVNGGTRVQAEQDRFNLI